jgi:hypothetical protein
MSMLTILARSRALVTTMLVALLVPCLSAAAEQSQTPDANRAPAGDPMLGMVIILGAIAFFIVLAWIFSRMGDDGGRGPDRTLL